jgi:hypothetical protein
MELTIPEQIKQCERIIENRGCNGIRCGQCQFIYISHSNKNTKERISLTLAKEKLKQLRGENMDIKIDDIIDSLEQIKTTMKCFKKEQEKEIEFVVGGVYENDKCETLALIAHGDKFNILWIYNDKMSTIHYKVCDVWDDNEKDMRLWLIGHEFKYTDRTLADIINK